MSDNNFGETMKGKKGLARVLKACGYSKNGLACAMTEAAFRQLIWLNGTLLIVLIFLDFSPITKMLLIMASFISLITELLNTAIEAAVDHTSLAQHPLAKRAKDVGSAAQMLALLMLAILWAMALWRDYGFNLF